MTPSATQTGILIGAILALTWAVLGFWPCLGVGVAMAVGAIVGRIIEGKLSVAGLVDAFRGKRTSS